MTRRLPLRPAFGRNRREMLDTLRETGLPATDLEELRTRQNKSIRDIDARLVLLGNVATDDPEGAQVYESLLDRRGDDIHILCHQDSALVNALQRQAAVVLQKFIREGFGLTVAEAMWKGTLAIGGNVGGIRYQVEDGVNGFLVDSVVVTAERIQQVVSDRGLRDELGCRARETVRENFLLTRLLEQHLDLLSSFEAEYRLSK